MFKPGEELGNLSQPDRALRFNRVLRNAKLCGNVLLRETVYFAQCDHLATAFGVQISPWNLQSIHIHMAAGLSNVKWIEYFMPDNALLEFQTRLFKEPLFREEPRDDGICLLPPDKPGLGIVLDEATAEATLIRED